MLTGFARGVKKLCHLMYPVEFLLLSGILIILIATFFSTVVMADTGRPSDAVGFYTIDGKVTWIVPRDNKLVIDLKGLTPSEMEKRFPMSAGAEAAIVHADLPRPVIIDSVRYEENQISRFNGKRLYFIIGKDGT